MWSSRTYEYLSWPSKASAVDSVEASVFGAIWVQHNKHMATMPKANGVLYFTKAIFNTWSMLGTARDWLDWGPRKALRENHQGHRQLGTTGMSDIRRTG